MTEPKQPTELTVSVQGDRILFSGSIDMVFFDQHVRHKLPLIHQALLAQGIRTNDHPIKVANALMTQLSIMINGLAQAQEDLETKANQVIRKAKAKT